MKIIDTRDENWESQLNFELNSVGGASDYDNHRNRPYNGQPQTDFGKRGETLVQGLTMRDIMDCFVMGLLDCTDQSKKVKDGTWRYRDLWTCDMEKTDPLAVAQNMMCHVEKMMNIFPNVPELSEDAISEMLQEEPSNEEGGQDE